MFSPAYRHSEHNDHENDDFKYDIDEVKYERTGKDLEEYCKVLLQDCIETIKAGLDQGDL